MGMASRHVVLFARAPRLGAVKKRLARDIGSLAALRFYRRTLTTVARRLNADPRWALRIAVTPDSAVSDGTPWPPGTTVFPQGHGDLGQRMARVFRSLPPGPAVIVGSDIPDLGPAHVAAAFDTLGRHDAVFGRAPDGGYWLIGLKRNRPVPHGFLETVRWSTDRALGDSLATLPADRTAACLDFILDDIDDGAAYAAWRRREGS